jgi:hypothetical protein
MKGSAMTRSFGKEQSRHSEEEEIDAYDDFDEDLGGVSPEIANDDLGLCPHGCRDDEDCEEPDCMGGPG